MTEKDRSEKQLLKNLQLISEEISDQINVGEYKNIEYLDNQRKEIIKSITKIPSKSTRAEIYKIIEMNKCLINKIEKNKMVLNKNYREFLNIVKAYK